MTSTRRSWRGPMPPAVVGLLLAGLSGACSVRRTAPRADLILMNARVYTLAWGEPAADGTPAASAPHGPAGWTPDAQDIHAIGDAANREALDFVAAVMADAPSARTGRHRIEHAQVLDAHDVPRFAASGVIASMQPPHAVEDMTWAEDRLGADRVTLAYAWRTLRRSGAHLVFSSDLPGTDHDVFYGLHSAITRQDRAGRPEGGWHAEQRMTPEEALRGYTTWAAYAAFAEEQTGVLAAGRWADLTAIDIDPLNVGETDPARLLAGKIKMTIVAGHIVQPDAER